MPTTIHLVRHGAYGLLDIALGGRMDHPLSDEGRAQAARLAESFGAGAIAAVISSPVARARETAAPLAARLGLEVRIESDLTEIDFGPWVGASFESLRDDPAWRAWNDFRGTAAIPGGETMLAVQARAVACMLRLAAAYPSAEVVAVSHADVIKALLAHVLGAPLELMRRMRIDPASASRIILYEAEAAVLGMNLPA